MAWKNVQYENGKMRTSEGGGGGGSSTFADLEDVNFSNLQDGQVPKYNSSTGKWENANESGGGGTVTDVKVDGQSVVDPQTGEANITMPTPPTIPVTDVKVNGTSVVDGDKEAQIKSYKEVTQSEYNALPDSKLNDGILYAIKDVGSSDEFPPLIYSDEEREVGVWRDGKPLYQKTINVGNLPATPNVTKYTNHNISDLGDVASVYGLAKNSSGTRLLLPNPSPTSSYVIQVSVSNTQIGILTGTDRSAFSGYVTLQYTKTTDTPGSGIWATQGALAHHYSTDEHIIGTWIDGKPLYEKTIEFGSLPNNSVKNVAHNISNIKKVINISGYASLSSTLIVMPLPYANPGNTSAQVGVIINNSNVEITSGSDRSSFTESYITIRYTKTTD